MEGECRVGKTRVKGSNTKCKRMVRDNQGYQECTELSEGIQKISQVQIHSSHPAESYQKSLVHNKQIRIQGSDEDDSPG